jgi:hypothetical protein
MPPIEEGHGFLDKTSADPSATGLKCSFERGLAIVLIHQAIEQPLSS